MAIYVFLQYEYNKKISLAEINLLGFLILSIQYLVPCFRTHNPIFSKSILLLKNDYMVFGDSSEYTVRCASYFFLNDFYILAFTANLKNWIYFFYWFNTVHDIHIHIAFNARYVALTRILPHIRIV